MMQIISAAAGALIVVIIGLPLLLLRRKTLLSIIDSKDVNRIPKAKRARFQKKGMPETEYMAAFEKENMNFAMRNPILWVLLCGGLCFFFLFIQAANW